MNTYNNVLNKTDMTSESNPTLKAVLSNKSAQKRFQDSKNITASNDNPNFAGCGVEMEKLKREVAQHIGQLEDKIKSLEDQPVNESLEKYKNFLMKDLLETGVMDQIDIDNLNSKLQNKIMSIEEAISKLENLKLTSKPKKKLNRTKNESDYNELPDDFYDKLGDPKLSKWDTAFNMLNTNKWQVPMPRPPVCINTSPCKVCPEVDATGSHALTLKDWDYSRKVMNLTINKDWANDQMDPNTSVPLNVMPKQKKIVRYSPLGTKSKIHPPIKTGALIPYNSKMEDKSGLPSLNKYRKINTNTKTKKNSKMMPMENRQEIMQPPTSQVQSFRNVDKSNEYVKKYKARFQ
jgi:hypothetical protein